MRERLVVDCAGFTMYLLLVAVALKNLFAWHVRTTVARRAPRMTARSEASDAARIYLMQYGNCCLAIVIVAAVFVIADLLLRGT